ncbi:MAG: hypothetical protein EOP48_09325 [Sphingobacteriales bacterium]|nr:MAG: hypothetical protein EOP48_09325 [Sphingobacteriales bacterium]
MEKVTKIEWAPKWDGGAPMPQVFGNGHKVYLIYTVADWDINSSMKFVKIGNSEKQGELLALVEFAGYTFKFGIANDEVFHGLPLYKSGLTEWAHIIEDSKWIEELSSIHRVHQSFNPFRWKLMKHYVFLFKDEILEVVAQDYKIDLYESSYVDVSNEVLGRMNNVC